MIVIGAASTGVSYVDNLYIDPTAANLNLPAGVISKPATPVVTDTDFRIISVSINGGGDLLIQFIPGGSGYRLTSSDDLSAAFVEETNAIYDGVDTYIVPSAFLNPDKDFFRVETAP